MRAFFITVIYAKKLATMRYLGAVSAFLGLMPLAESKSSYVADLSILAFAGTPVGKVVPFNGRK